MSLFLGGDLMGISFSVHGRFDYNSQEVRAQLQNMVDNNLNKQLRKEYRRVAGIANKRIARIDSDDTAYSPALASLKRTTGKTHFLIKGMKNQEVVDEIKFIYNFLGEETSTLGGAKKYQKQVIDDSGLGIHASRKAINEVWKVIHRAQEVSPVVYNYKDLGEYVYKLISGDTKILNMEHGDEFDEWVKMAVYRIEGAYKKGIDALMADFPRGF